MRIIIQRVIASQVEIEGQTVAKIGKGLNLLLGIQEKDTDIEIDWMVKKCLELKLFRDEANKPWQKSIQDINGEILVVSQFTLYADCRKGRRPSFSNSASSDTAEVLYNQFVKKLKNSGLKVETGKFGAMMQVSIENDGPVTLILEK